MEETVIVIMIKEKATGFLEKELTTCRINQNMDKYLLNAFASLEDDSTYIHLKLTVDGEFTDDQFNDIFDCYDCDIYEDATCTEVDGCYNPTWELIFCYNEQTLEKTVNSFLLLHENELLEVFKLIDEQGQLTQW